MLIPFTNSRVRIDREGWANRHAAAVETVIKAEISCQENIICIKEQIFLRIDRRNKLLLLRQRFLVFFYVSVVIGGCLAARIILLHFPHTMMDNLGVAMNVAARIILLHFPRPVLCADGGICRDSYRSSKKYARNCNYHPSFFHA